MDRQLKRLKELFSKLSWQPEKEHRYGSKNQFLNRLFRFEVRGRDGNEYPIRVVIGITDYSKYSEDGKTEIEYDIAFGSPEDDVGVDYETLNQVDATDVVATVMDIVTNQVAEDTPQRAKLTWVPVADDDRGEEAASNDEMETSRGRIYGKLLPRYMKKIGYELVEKDHSGGVTEYIFERQSETLTELVDATNYWISPEGELNRVGDWHEDWAKKQKTTTNKLLASGWTRIVLKHNRGKFEGVWLNIELKPKAKRDTERVLGAIRSIVRDYEGMESSFLQITVDLLRGKSQGSYDSYRFDDREGRIPWREIRELL